MVYNDTLLLTVVIVNSGGSIICKTVSRNVIRIVGTSTFNSNIFMNTLLPSVEVKLVKKVCGYLFAVITCMALHSNRYQELPIITIDLLCSIIIPYYYARDY